jgi:hypothetical protein
VNSWTADDPEWLEVARMQLLLERAKDETLPAEQRIAAVNEYFDWLDVHFPGLTREVCLPLVPDACRVLADLWADGLWPEVHS